MTGEELHAMGADGLRRAKLWLEATTRAEVHWLNPDPAAVPKLNFDWETGGSFSFDVGGVLRGGEVDAKEFLAECKLYKAAQDQPQLYKEYLAKCFRVWKVAPSRADNFMWITWAPFSAKTWDKLCTAERVREAVMANENRVGAENVTTLEEDCAAVAERLWVIVLSERQERSLTMSREHLAVIKFHVTKGGGLDGL